MKNELVERKSTEVSTDVADLGVANDLTMEDIGLGRICLMQSSSNMVKQGIAQQATFINIANPTEVLGTKTKPLEFIIASHLKYWIELNEDSQEFMAKYPARSNENELKWNETVNGIKVQRTYHFAYIVVLPDEVKTGVIMPYELAFRSTSLKVAKQINNILMKMAGQKVPSWAKTFKLSPGDLVSKGKNSWLVPKVELGRDATAQEIEAVKEMRGQFSAVQTKIMSETGDVYKTAAAPEAEEQTEF